MKRPYVVKRSNFVALIFHLSCCMIGSEFKVLTGILDPFEKQWVNKTVSTDTFTETNHTICASAVVSDPSFEPRRHVVAIVGEYFHHFVINKQGVV